MIAYRIEDNDNYGPWRSINDVCFSMRAYNNDDYFQDGYSEQDHYYKFTVKNPSPQNENLPMTLDYVCGCHDISLLFETWAFHMLPSLSKHGFKVSVYYLPDNANYHIGSSQMIFIRCQAKMLFTMSINQAYELSQEGR